MWRKMYSILLTAIVTCEKQHRRVNLRLTGSRLFEILVTALVAHILSYQHDGRKLPQLPQALLNSFRESLCVQSSEPYEPRHSCDR